jgi:hypothetical protein
VANSIDGRLVSFAERAAIVILISYLCVHSLPRAWKSLVTDFSNYYLAARIAHEGADASRIYEWRWFEREKDHRGMDIRVIGLVPLTPFSTLFVWPLTGLEPLAAKHVWIVVNLLLIIPIGWMLKSMTGLSYQRIGLIFALCFPLYRNLEYGQFYLVLLLMIVSACWMYLRGMHGAAGVLVAIAAASKIFPVLIFIVFLQRRSWRAIAWGALTGVIAVIVSIGVFGLNVHRTYLFEILPRVMQGEGAQPFVLNASLSTVLHLLFLSEPQWNPHPWHLSVLAYALLLPALQMIVLAPAILLIRRDDCSKKTILLEWSAIITASLAISTNPASYHFVVMIFPMCVLSAILLERRQYSWFGLLLVAFIGIGFPLSHPPGVSGLRILFYVPRLPLIIAVLAGIYVLLRPTPQSNSSSRSNWTRYAWVSLMVASVILSSRSTFLRERAVQQEFVYRLPLIKEGLLNADPQADGATARFIAFTMDGYRLMTNDRNADSVNVSDSPDDVLSFASGARHLWLEHAGNSRSTIVDLKNTLQSVVLDGRNPMSSLDGRELAYIRDDHGRGSLTVNAEAESGGGTDRALSPLSLDVYEASFNSEKEFAFAASAGSKAPELYLTDATHSNSPLGLAGTRYPALSPDGSWLAYSHLEHGVWNLWVRNESTGQIRRVGDVPCNQIEPSWESDSKTVLYGSDCGRSLWFTAIARRKIIP